MPFTSSGWTVRLSVADRWRVCYDHRATDTAIRDGRCSNRILSSFRSCAAGICLSIDVSATRSAGSIFPDAEGVCGGSWEVRALSRDDHARVFLFDSRADGADAGAWVG